MIVHQQVLEVATAGHGSMHDLTEQVQAVVEASGVQQGTVTVFNIGSTAAVGTIEFEPGLQQDLPRELDRLFPPGEHYAHHQTWHDGNGHSHLQATTLGPSLVVPVAQGRLVLGTWQQVFLLECDVRPRQRRVHVTVMGTPQSDD